MKIMDSELEKILDAIKEVPSRDSDMAENSRARYLSEIKSVGSGAVSNSDNLRHTNWKQKISYLFKTRKEFVPMLTQIISAILIATTLIAGGGGATVYASQNAMPGSVLYPVKIWSEDARLGFAQNTSNQFDLNLEYADRRVQELINMDEEGLSEIDDPAETSIQIVERLQLHIQESLRLAGEVGDPEKAMIKLQTHLQTQTRLLGQQPESADPEFEKLMLQTQMMLQERLRLVDEQLDPLYIRQQNQAQEQNQIHSGTKMPNGNPATVGEGPNGPAKTAQGTPGSGYGPGPNVEETPTPGGQFGPGTQHTPVQPGNNWQPSQAPSEPNNGDNKPGNGGKGGK